MIDEPKQLNPVLVERVKSYAESYRKTRKLAPIVVEKVELFASVAENDLTRENVFLVSGHSMIQIEKGVALGDLFGNEGIVYEWVPGHVDSLFVWGSQVGA